LRFFARLTVICNICFIITVILRAVEQARRAKGSFDGLIGFQPLQATIVILGYGAIILNLAFLIAAITWYFRGSLNRLPRWIVWFNLILFPCQLYVQFLSK